MIEINSAIPQNQTSDSIDTAIIARFSFPNC